MRKLKSAVLAGACAVASACASTPDVVATHYLPRGDLTLRAVRSVGCATNAKGEKQLFVATSVTPTSSYTRDVSSADTVELKALDGPMSNTATTISFYEDGRLKGVNSSSEGVGPQIVASAVKLATMAIGGGIVPLIQVPQDKDVCDLITEQQPKEKLLTMTFVLTDNFPRELYGDNFVRTAKLELEPTNPSYMPDIAAKLPVLCAAIGPLQRPTPSALVRGSARPVGQTVADDPTLLTLRHPAHVPAMVVESAAKGKPGAPNVGPCGVSWTEIWSGSIPVPQLGTDYELAVPKAAAFGSTALELSVAESGAVTSVKYGRHSGVPGVLAALTSAADAAQPSTAEEKAKEAKAEADLIAQQQRLIRCQMNPSTCT